MKALGVVFFSLLPSMMMSMADTALVLEELSPYSTIFEFSPVGVDCREIEGPDKEEIVSVKIFTKEETTQQARKRDAELLYLSFLLKKKELERGIDAIDHTGNSFREIHLLPQTSSSAPSQVLLYMDRYNTFFSLLPDTEHVLRKEPECTFSYTLTKQEEHKVDGSLDSNKLFLLDFSFVCHNLKPMIPKTSGLLSFKHIPSQKDPIVSTLSCSLRLK